MITAGIVVEDWKLPVFKRHLDKKKYSYEVVSFGSEGVFANCSSIKVKAETAEELKPIVGAAYKECRERGRLH